MSVAMTRNLNRLVDIVSAAEGAGWDMTHPRMLERARSRLWTILWAQAPELATAIYGPQA